MKGRAASGLGAGGVCACASMAEPPQVRMSDRIRVRMSQYGNAREPG